MSKTYILCLIFLFLLNCSLFLADEKKKSEPVVIVGVDTNSDLTVTVFYSDNMVSENVQIFISTASEAAGYQVTANSTCATFSPPVLEGDFLHIVIITVNPKCSVDFRNDPLTITMPGQDPGVWRLSPPITIVIKETEVLKLVYLPLEFNMMTVSVESVKAKADYKVARSISLAFTLSINNSTNSKESVTALIPDSFKGRSTHSCDAWFINEHKEKIAILAQYKAERNYLPFQSRSKIEYFYLSLLDVPIGPNRSQKVNIDCIFNNKIKYMKPLAKELLVAFHSPTNNFTRGDLLSRHMLTVPHNDADATISTNIFTIETYSLEEDPSLKKFKRQLEHLRLSVIVAAKRSLGESFNVGSKMFLLDIETRDVSYVQPVLKPSPPGYIQYSISFGLAGKYDPRHTVRALQEELKSYSKKFGVDGKVTVRTETVFKSCVMQDRSGCGENCVPCLGKERCLHHGDCVTFNCQSGRCRDRGYNAATRVSVSLIVVLSALVLSLV